MALVDHRQSLVHTTTEHNVAAPTFDRLELPTGQSDCLSPQQLMPILLTPSTPPQDTRTSDATNEIIEVHSSPLYNPSMPSPTAFPPNPEFGNEEHLPEAALHGSVRSMSTGPNVVPSLTIEPHQIPFKSIETSCATPPPFGTPDMLGASPVPQTTAEILAHRRAIKFNSSAKRSASQPNIRAPDLSGMSMADKRRNKLGYHRTSIACTHCRRRKIRCLMAPDDPHRRCANCIRLKKECTFFPVDQQPGGDRRARSGTKLDGSSSTESSPILVGTGHIDEGHFDPFQPLSLTTQGFHPNTTWHGNATVSPLTHGPLEHLSQQSNGFSLSIEVDDSNIEPGRNASYDFSQPPHVSNGHPAWHSPFDGNPISAGHSPGEVSASYWGGQTGSPLTPGGYSPHAQTAGGLDPRASFASYAPSVRNDSLLGWPTHVPARSMSIGIIEDLPSHYGHGRSGGSLFHPHHLNVDYQSAHSATNSPVHMGPRRRASEMMQPPALITSSNSTHNSISDSSSLSSAHFAPLSAPVSSPPAHWGIPSGWSQLPSSAVTKPTDYNGWYSEPGLAKVQEEEVPPPFGEQPTIVYPDELS